MKKYVPKFVKNITSKMVIIWMVSFTLLVVVGFGSTAGIMALLPKDYAKSIKLSDVAMVTYKNENHSKQLFLPEYKEHGKPMRGILNRLDDARKTNVLMDMFRGDQIESTSHNTSTISSLSTFDSNYAKNAIIIDFKTPQYRVEVTTRSAELVKGNGTNAVWRILIPLNNTGNSFQEQTWYLFIVDPLTNIWTSSIQYRYTTYGNYHDLWNYVSERFVKF